MAGKAPVYTVDVWRGTVDGSSARFCTVNAVAKLSSEDHPYEVPNEFVCSYLGHLIGLPTPPGAIVTTDDKGPAFITLQFGPGGQQPPPVVVEDFMADHAHLAAGIVAFDCWIGNEDRHAWNLAYQKGRIAPMIFDQGDALMGVDAQAAEARLQGGLDLPMVGNSCLAPKLESADDVKVWAERIKAVPKDLVEQRCRQLDFYNAGVTGDEIGATINFLLSRKERVQSLLLDDVHVLPAITGQGVL